MLTQIKVKTSKRNELVNITFQIEKIVSDSKVKDGLCLVFCPHTTAGIIVNENSDSDVVNDLLNALDHLVPSIKFNHAEGNSDAHLKSTLVGCEKQFIVQNGALALGTWQGIFFAEFDGPRERKVFVKLVEG
ncbi:MAG: secondary thiamine-phosphate synthase enzyme YjbQ [archaeon]|jgi:secondary thiamine-phosphate synthase enzyme